MLVALAALVPVVMITGTWLACALSGWNTLARATRARLEPESRDETSRFCTVSLTKRRVFTHFRSFTTVRRQGALVELTLTLVPAWLAPPVFLDLVACEVESCDRDLSVRDARTGVLIRPIGRARELFERALRDARTAAIVPPALLNALAPGARPVDTWLADLRRLGAGRPRALAADREKLWTIVEDELLASRVRVGAAMALHAGEVTGAERAKLVAIGHAAKDPLLANALEHPDEPSAFEALR